MSKQLTDVLISTNDYLNFETWRVPKNWKKGSNI